MSIVFFKESIAQGSYCRHHKISSPIALFIVTKVPHYSHHTQVTFSAPTMLHPNEYGPRVGRLHTSTRFLEQHTGLLVAEAVEARVAKHEGLPIVYARLGNAQPHDPDDLTRGAVGNVVSQLLVAMQSLQQQNPRGEPNQPTQQLWPKYGWRFVCWVERGCRFGAANFTALLCATQSSLIVCRAPTKTRRSTWQPASMFVASTASNTCQYDSRQTLLSWTFTTYVCRSRGSQRRQHAPYRS